MKPLTLSLSDSDQTRGRLWTWFVRMGIGYRYRDAYPGWILDHQQQCINAECELQRLIMDRAYDLGILVDSCTVPLRTRGGVVQAQLSRKGLTVRCWRHLCTVEELRNKSIEGSKP